MMLLIALVVCLAALGMLVALLESAHHPAPPSTPTRNLFPWIYLGVLGCSLFLGLIVSFV